MKIAEIKAKPNNKFILEVDNENYQLLSDTLVYFNIYKPCDIDKNTFNSMLEKNTFFVNYNKLKTYISFKMRTTKDIEKKLFTLHVPKNKHKEYIDKLKEDNLLNDDKYKEAYIKDQINLTLNGPRKIIFQLDKLGFKDVTLDEYDDIWVDRVNKIIDRKKKANHKLSNKVFKLKLKNDLLNLGYYENQFVDIISNISIDDSIQKQKDYEKYKNKLSKKYSDDELEYKLNQKMYELGYK